MKEFENLRFDYNDYVYISVKDEKEAKKINNIWYNIIPFATKEGLCIYLVHSNKWIRDSAKERYDHLNGK
jgi:hypothetical protein